MKHPTKETVRFSLTRSERNSLLVLATLLLIGLVTQQVKRHLDRDTSRIVIENATLLAPLDAEGTPSGPNSVGNDSPRLDATSSKDVTSVPSPEGAVSHSGRSATSPDVVAGTANMIHVNRATSAELQSLPGIGPVLAERILEWRRVNGSFKRVDDLLLVRGIGEVRLEQLRPLVTVEP